MTEAQTTVQEDADPSATHDPTATPVSPASEPEAPGDATLTAAPDDDSVREEAVQDAPPAADEPMEVRPTQGAAPLGVRAQDVPKEAEAGSEELAAPLSAVSLAKTTEQGVSSEAAETTELGVPFEAAALAASAEPTALAEAAELAVPEATLRTDPAEAAGLSADPSADTVDAADETLAAAAPESGAAPVDDDFDDFGDFAEQDDDLAAPADPTASDAPSSASASVHDSTPVSAAASMHESAPASAAASVASLPPPAAQPSVDVHAPREAIRATVAELLPDFVDAAAPSSAEADLTREPLREIEGPAQVLVSDASRAFFRELQTPVPIASTPLDWTRSATRRRHLISLGIPVNLDEVQQPAASHAVLPPLELHVEPAKSSGPGAARASDAASPAAGAASPAEGAAPAEGWGARRRRELGGEPPEVSMERVEELVAIGEDQLTLKALPELRALAREMRALSKQMSDLLAHHLMVREAFHADAEVYNAMIRDLVAGASTKHATTRKLEKRGLLSRATSLRRSRPGTPT